VISVLSWRRLLYFVCEISLIKDVNSTFVPLKSIHVPNLHIVLFSNCDELPAIEYEDGSNGADGANSKGGNNGDNDTITTSPFHKSTPSNT